MNSRGRKRKQIPDNGIPSGLQGARQSNNATLNFYGMNPLNLLGSHGGVHVPFMRPWLHPRVSLTRSVALGGRFDTKNSTSHGSNPIMTPSLSFASNFPRRNQASLLSKGRETHGDGGQVTTESLQSAAGSPGSKERVKLPQLPCCNEHPLRSACLRDPTLLDQRPRTTPDTRKNCSNEPSPRKRLPISETDEFDEIQRLLEAICFAKPEILTSKLTLTALNCSNIPPLQDDLLRKYGNLDISNDEAQELSNARQDKSQKKLFPVYRGPTFGSAYIPRIPLPFENVFDISSSSEFSDSKRRKLGVTEIPVFEGSDTLERSLSSKGSFNVATPAAQEWTTPSIAAKPNELKTIKAT